MNRKHWLILLGALLLLVVLIALIVPLLLRSSAPLLPVPLSPSPPITSSPSPLVSASPALLVSPSPSPPPHAFTETFTPVPATGSDDVPMVEVPAGEFLMGSQADDIERWEQVWLDNVLQRQIRTPGGYGGQFIDEWPQLTVQLHEFYIDQVKVTNARYHRCVDAGVCFLPKYSSDYYADSAYANHPVVGVTLEQAQTFCRWVGKRLPTEAEWEKAARGTDGRIYPWGNEWDVTQLNAEPETKSVGSYQSGASPYGALDMVGNVAEWVSTSYTAYPGGRLYAPPGDTIAVGGYVYRGGLYRTNADFMPELAYRIAERGGVKDHGFYFISRFVGFRCVRGPEPQALENVIVGSSVQAVPTLESMDLTGMVEVPAGEFAMGSDLSLGWRPTYSPQHTVDLDTYYIDRYEVTNAQYVEFLNALGQNYLACDSSICVWLQTEEMLQRESNPSRILAIGNQYTVEAGYENHPADHVSWDGAQMYCQWLGKRLPTEAEWEKAARGTDARLFPWGNEWDPEKIGYGKSLSPVGSYPDDISPYGVMDVQGSAREWVADWYDPDYYSWSPARNPTGPTESAEHKERVARPDLETDELFLRGQGMSEGFRCVYTP